MAQPLMPKATAVWMVDNTTLTFEQIAEFCGLHALEVQAIADGDVAAGMQGADPVTVGFLSQEELDRCQANSRAKLKMLKATLPQPKVRGKGARYTPVSKRQDRPDAISWLLKHHPEMIDAQIARLIGTTKPTIKTIRERSHWNISKIKPQSPVGLGLCSETELEKMVTLARRKAERVRLAQEKENKKRAAAGEALLPVDPAPAPTPEPQPAPMAKAPEAPEVIPTAESVFGEAAPAPKEEEPAPDAASVFKTPSSPEGESNDA